MGFLGVYFSLNGEIIPTNGYVLIWDIGSSDYSALLCHTNRPPPLGSVHSEGNWFAPDGTRVNYDDVPGVTRDRGPHVVRLKRTYGTAAGGMYWCSVFDAEENLQIVHVGIYNEGQGWSFIIYILFNFLAICRGNQSYT